MVTQTNYNRWGCDVQEGRGPILADWQEFTETQAPMRVQRSPRLVLIGRDFHGRTGSAFDFLIENGLPVKLIRVAIYEDSDGRRFVDIEGQHEAELPLVEGADGGGQTVDPTLIDGRRVQLADLLEAGLLQPAARLVWERPRVGHSYRAIVTDGGTIQLEDGREFATPSGAAMNAAGLVAYDGWYAWRVDAGERPRLHDLRVELARRAGGQQ